MVNPKVCNVFTERNNWALKKDSSFFFSKIYSSIMKINKTMFLVLAKVKGKNHFIFRPKSNLHDTLPSYLYLLKEKCLSVLLSVMQV